MRSSLTSELYHRSDTSFWVCRLEYAMDHTLNLLGLSVSSPEECMDGMKRLCLFRSGISEEDIAKSIDERADARKNKDFARADGVRRVVLSKRTPFEGDTCGSARLFCDRRVIRSTDLFFFCHYDMAMAWSASQ